LLSLNQLPEPLKADVRAQPGPVSKSVLIEIARLDDATDQAALWERLKAGATVRDARRVKARGTSPPPPAPRDELGQIARASERLLRRLEAVTAAGLRRDPTLLTRLRELRRRLDGILADD
jgi:ParB family chromosome partitioning protein